jgi:protocatechuate 4,5-dioxygenase beta chain
VPIEQIMQVAGTDAAELSMWYTMRAALSPHAKKAYSFYALPAVTGCGVVVLDEPSDRA